MQNLLKKVINHLYINSRLNSEHKGEEEKGKFFSTFGFGRIYRLSVMFCFVK